MTGTDLALTVALLSSGIVALSIVLALVNEVLRGWHIWQGRRFAKQQEREWKTKS